MKILFLCAGNVSRSYLAEALLKNELECLSHADGFSVFSAGLHAFQGSPPDPNMAAYLREKGIEMKGHRARQVRKEDLEWADLILVMEKSHGETINKTWPQEAGKVKLLGAYIPSVLGEEEIADPYGRSPYHYRLAQARIALAVKSLAKSLIALPQGQRPRPGTR
jgi:protein-tyrosine phosphatase